MPGNLDKWQLALTGSLVWAIMALMNTPDATGPVAAVAQVAAPVPFADTLSYRCLPGTLPRPGARVAVRVNNRPLVGVVTAVCKGAEDCDQSVLSRKLKDLEAVLDTQPFLPPENLAFLRKVASYYLTPLGEVVATAIPKWFRRLPAKPPPPEYWWTVTGRLTRIEQETLGKRAPRQLAVYKAVADAQIVLGKDLAAIVPQAASVCRQLEKKGLLACQDSGVVENRQPERPGFRLTADQQAAVGSILDRRGFGVSLLDGITGSGKTEVYIRAIEAQLNQGRKSLVLVPEIGLTPQLFGSIARRVRARVAVLHSGLSDGARARVWQRARDGVVDVLVCTRSGVFAPMPGLGLIIVDEEHDSSFKQQDGLRYHARDLAVLRGHMEDVPVILGSATPSLESLHNARSGKYQWLKLRQRTNNSPLPGISLLNMQGKPLRGGLATRVIERIGQELEAGNQVLVFLNRRGWAPALLCHGCGRVSDCTHCDAKLIYHRRRNQLRCHHCGRHYSVPEFCSQCGSPALQPVGEGTEKLADILAAAFGDERVLQVDRDTVRSAAAWKRTLAYIRSGRACVIVGTQMLSKGHDFPNLTLVVVVNVDANFHSLDFRAPEKLAQLLVQVSGRAGRKDRPGKVVIQTHFPHQPLFVRLFGQGYASFAEQELQQRIEVGFPPASHMAMVRARGPDAETVESFLRQVMKGLPVCETVAVMGPVESPLFRKGGQFHMQVFFNSRVRGDLRTVLRAFLSRARKRRAPAGVYWSLDIDPQDLA